MEILSFPEAAVPRKLREQGSILVGGTRIAPLFEHARIERYPGSIDKLW